MSTIQEAQCPGWETGSLAPEALWEGVVRWGSALLWRASAEEDRDGVEPMPQPTIAKDTTSVLVQNPVTGPAKRLHVCIRKMLSWLFG